MSRSHAFLYSLTLLASVGLVLSIQPAAESGQGKLGPNPTDVQKVLDKAVGFLKTSQTKDGGFSPKFAGPGITALAAASLIRNGVSP